MVYRRETGRACSHVILCCSYHHYIVKYKMRFWNCLKCGRELRRAVCYSRSTFKRGDYSPLTPCASRLYRAYRDEFAKIRFSLKWPCVCEISDFVELTHPFLWSRSFLIQSPFRKFRNVSEGNFGEAREDLERQRLEPTLSWLKIWRTVLLLVGQL